MRRELLLLAVSIGLSALVLEGLLRLAFPPAPPWVEPQTRYLESPLLGWVLEPGSRSYTIDAPVAVNSHGIRDDEFPIEKLPGERRILVLGDSFTFALGVRFEDLYVQKLEQLLEADGGADTFQVINAGVAGYNTRQELIYLLTDGMRFAPDLLVVGFYWNDLLGNARPLPDLSAPRFDPETRVKRRADHAIPRVLREWLRRSQLFYQTVTRTKQLAGLLSPPTHEIARVQRALLNGDAEMLAPYWSQAEQRLRQIAAAAVAAGIEAILVAFPMENEIVNDYPDLVFAERLREIWEPTGMPFIDLTGEYRASLRAGQNPFLPYDLHPGPIGMRIAAQELHAVIQNGGLLTAPEPAGGQ